MESVALATAYSHAMVGPPPQDLPQHSPSLLDLPPELLHQVLQDAHPRLRATCRAVRDLIDGSCTAWRLVRPPPGGRLRMRDLTALLRRLPLLTSVTVDRGASQTLLFLSCCTGLTTVSITDCHLTDKELDALTRRSRLTSLSLISCPQLESCAALAALTSLQLLKVHGCGRMGSVSWVTALSNLTSLSFDQLHLGPGGLAGLTALRTLASLLLPHLPWQWAPVDLSPLTHCTALTLLDLSWCCWATGLESLSALPSLTSLSLAHCWCLIGVSWLSALTALQHLDVSGSTNLVPPLPLAGCTHLRTLVVTGCYRTAAQERQALQALCGPQLRIDLL